MKRKKEKMLILAVPDDSIQLIYQLAHHSPTMTAAEYAFEKSGPEKIENT